MFEVDQLFANRYRLLAKIGVGGFSEVWKAADQMAEEAIVAIKIYAPERGMDDRGLSQFRREYAVVLNLNHANLLTARHFDISDGHPFLVMPYIGGGSLGDRLSDQGSFSEQILASLLHQIGNALAYLHSKEVLHQDIKPDNILIGDDRQFLLTDFGISSRLRSTLRKSTTTGRSMTVAYAPPERFDAVPRRLPAGDVFSLGVLCYELATGEVPWMGSGGMSLQSGARIPEVGDGFTERFRRLLKSMMAIRPEDRPSAVELSRAAQDFLESGSWPEIKATRREAEGDSSPEPAEPPRRGRKTVLMDQVIPDVQPAGAPEKPASDFGGGQHPPATPAGGAAGEADDRGKTMRDSDAADKFLNPQKKKKKSKAWVYVMLALLILAAAGGWVWQEYGDQLNPEKMRQYTTLMAQADLLAERGDWEEALEKYREAYGTIANPLASDSIFSIESRLARIAREEAARRDNDAWERAVQANTIAGFDKYLQDFPDGAYTGEARHQRRVIEDRIQAERDRERLEREARAADQARRDAEYARLRREGDTHFGARRYEQAISAYRQALQFKPGDLHATQRISDSEARMPYNYHDDFTQAGKTFRNSTNDGWEWRHEQGYLKAFSTNDGFTYNNTIRFPRLENARRFEISVDVRIMRGSETHGAGLIFMSDGVDPSNRFGVNGRGSFYVGKIEGGSWAGDWSQNSSVRNRGNWNSIKVVYDGNQITYFVNNTQVDRKPLSRFGTSAGLYFSGSLEETWFNNLRITATFE